MLPANPKLDSSPLDPRRPSGAGARLGPLAGSCPAAVHGVVHTDLRITAWLLSSGHGGNMEMQARGARSSVWQTGCGAKGDVEGEVAGVPPTPRWLRRITQSCGLPGVSSSLAALPSALDGYRLSCLSAPGSAPPAFQGPPSPGPGEPLAPCSRPWHNPFVTPSPCSHTPPPPPAISYPASSWSILPEPLTPVPKGVAAAVGIWEPG